MLGTYKVHKGLTAAEKNATEGELQPDFKAWVLKLISDAEAAGFDNIATVGDGFVSYKTATDEYYKGKKSHLDDIQLFCRGLAWEYTFAAETVTSAVKRGGTAAVAAVQDAVSDTSSAQTAADWIEENAARYGLQSIVKTEKGSGTVKIRFFRPKSISYDSDVHKVEYEGDAPDDIAGAAGAMSGTGSVSSVAYFFSNQFNTIQTSMESELLQGERALANDAPVYNTITNVVASSMRSFSSTPDGKFIAWYPDYWGKAGNTPVMTISDIELIDLRITQSDKEFYSHVYCTGVNADGTSLAVYQSQGVVSIESNLDALAAEAEVNEAGAGDVSDEVSYLLQKILYIPEGEEWKYTPKELYRRYGARPKNADLTNLGSAKLIEAVGEENAVNPTYIMPFLYALYSFMQHWAQQNQVQVEITFNPSIIPGCRIRLESLDVSFYVHSVTHTMDYSGGFTTSIDAICPTGTLVSGMVNV